MNRRLRFVLLTIAGLAAATLLAAFIAMYVVLQPERFTALLQSQARQAGLELTLANPASPTLWPTPALELNGLSLSARGNSTPMIAASHGRLVLPWHTLLGGDTVVSRLELEGARIDLDAINAYIDTLPSRSSMASAFLPTIDAGFSITRGTLLRGNRLLLSNVQVDAGRLANGQRFPLTLAARTGDGTPYSVDLKTTPQLTEGVLTLGDVALAIASEPRFKAALAGEALWRGGADIGAQLAGKITRADAETYDVVANVTPANQSDPLSIALRLDGKNDHADVRLPPLELAQWWSTFGTGGSLTLPPVRGSIAADVIDAGGIHIEGLRIQAGDAPASTSSTADTPKAKTP
ncbi:AsmA protein [Luteibacter rhizovicinus]|uniref:AsmA protein n=1 Tax=Luteibacter rhizovicinus TaxID=242606 RepID=A0A4R3YR60_9GAMM|nr:membrane assembly protein AsmA [Luteibacter rhizovicinus]TCV94118.1 AsmA protein [Luteibacter rhizovicinus]